MIEVIDRIPAHPGRVKMTPVSGQTDTYDMVRADEPIEVGTPINKALFESIGSDITALNQNVANIINAHASLAEIGSLPAGAEFGVYENNILVPYIKVDGDYGGGGRSAVMRKHIYKRDFLTTSAQGTAYVDSACDTWLNTEYLDLLDERTRAAIEPVTITYTVGNGNLALATIDRRVFIASITEYGSTDGTHNVEGTPFSYFTTAERRVAQYNGVATSYWSRSAQLNSPTWMGFIRENGGVSAANPSSVQYGIRPVFTLPHDFEVAMNNPNTANVNATAEVI